MDTSTKNRQRAYQFIHDKLQESGRTSTEGAQPFPLADLYLLKNGLADPTDELLEGLRRALLGVVTQADFENFLVTPFRCNQPAT